MSEKKAKTEPMRTITFRLDEATWDALRALEELEGPNIRGRKSALLRRLILDAFELENSK